ncbi:hypothetical protein PHYBOEH_003959 [Phytophthora boehmeriae]|uniref:Transmembrane protein n=1 Tax=Phytophthora boehmeriae TaxID=109152 RepID=A0A8T1WMQ8_9STRA|nr:hypothetical protein PHYBOEH_003959 [Phytophthora boehmeriae]
MCAAGVALAALLLLLLAAIVRLAVLLVQLVTLRYTLALSVLLLSGWFLDSRRRRYARGFYSCSQVPQTAPRLEEETQTEGGEKTLLAAVAPVAPVEAATEQLKKVTTAPPSETESEDDDSEATSAVSSKKPVSSSTSRHSQSLADVRARSNTSDGELQRRLATRPRSSSAAGDRANRLPTADNRPRALTSRGTRTNIANVPMEKKRRVPRRRADTGTTNDKHKERSRRATFASKQDAYMAAGRSSSEMLEDALRSDGYWIGDFSVQRRLVARRSHASSHTSSPKAI